MLKLLKLKFKNAGHIMYKHDGSYREIGTGVVSEESETPKSIDVPIDTLPSHCVSGALHVLLGERPVPRVRKTGMSDCLLKTVESIGDMANRSFVNITDGIYKNDKHETKLVKHSLMSRKSSKKSTFPASFEIDLNDMSPIATSMITYDRLMAKLGREKYQNFMIKVSEEFGNVHGLSLTELLQKCNKNDVMKNYALEKMADPWKTLISKGRIGDAKSMRTNRASMPGHSLALNYTVSKGKLDFSYRGGEILVPIEECDIQRLENGPGHARILDGGIVTIDGIYDYSERLFLGFKPVDNGESHEAN